MPPRPPPPPPTTDLLPGESLEDVHPIRLARILAEKWASLPDATKEVIWEELADGGVMAAPINTGSGGGSAVVETLMSLPTAQERLAEQNMAELRSLLKVSPGPLPLADTLQVLTTLSAHLGTLGQMLAVVWSAWRSTLEGDKRIQPSAASRRPILEHLRERLDGLPDSGDLTLALRDQLAAGRLLIAILSGLGEGSLKFASAFSRHLDPDMIVQELRKSRGGRAPSAEDLWNRYKQLANAMTPSEIEHQLRQHVVEAAETFFHKAHRG